MALAETAELAVRISLNDQLSRGIVGIQGKLNGLNAGMGRAGRGAGQMAAGFARAGAIAAGAAATGIGLATKATIDWEEAFTGVVKTVDEADLKAAGLTFRDLELKLRGLAKQGVGTHEELAAIAEAAGALGIAGKDIEAFTKVAASIGLTTNVSADEAATALGQLSNVMKLTVEDYDNFGATLVDLGNKGASTEAQILEIATRVGAAATLIGVGKAETLGWSSAIANLGIEVEAGGSSLQKFFLESTRNVAAGGDELTLMAKIAGKTGKAFKKAFEDDASGALTEFLKGLGKLDQADQLAALKDLGFDDIRITRALLGLAGDVDNLTDSVQIANNAWEDNAALNVEVEKRFATVGQRIGRLKTNLRDLAITFGEGIAPAIGRAADKLAAFLSNTGNADKVRQIGEEIGRAIDGIDWAKVIDGVRQFVDVLKGAMTVAKAMYDLFSALPTEIKAATVGFLALNKLSGGLIAAGAGNVVGGLAETAVRAGGSRLPGGLGRLFAQPVYVVNFPPGFGGGGGPVPAGGKTGGGLAGKIGTGLSIAAAVAAVAGAVEVDAQQRAQANEQSRQISADLKAFLASNPTRDQIDAVIRAQEAIPNSLDPIQRGIFELNHNGVKTVWEAGLAELRAARAGIDLLPKHGGLSPDDRQAIRSTALTFREGERQTGSILKQGLTSVSASLDGFRAGERATSAALQQRLATVQAETAKVVQANREAAFAVRDAERATTTVKTATDNVKAAVAAGFLGQRSIGERTAATVASARTDIRGTTSAVGSGASRIVAAIRASRPIINVTSSHVTRNITTQNRYGPGTGSSGAGSTRVRTPV